MESPEFNLVMIARIFDKNGGYSESTLRTYVEELIRKRPYSLFQEPFNLELGISPPRLGRVTRPRANLWESVWGKMLLHPDIDNPTSRVSKLFRRRFRVPYDLFKNCLVPLCLEHDVFRLKQNSLIPLEFRLLIALRILGRGCTADDCNELSDVPESTCNTIFKTFCRNFTSAVSAPILRSIFSVINSCCSFFRNS